MLSDARTLSAINGGKTLIAAGVMQSDGAATVLTMHWSGKWKVGVCCIVELLVMIMITGYMLNYMCDLSYYFSILICWLVLCLGVSGRLPLLSCSVKSLRG